jgi:hypothetical protein
MWLRPSFDEVKARYADPVPVARSEAGVRDAPRLRPTYCVGGAFLRAVGEAEETFPTPTVLARGLARYLGRSFRRSRTPLLCTAVNIILANDGGEVAHAWDVLERAMEGDLLDPRRCRFEPTCGALRRRPRASLPPAEVFDLAESILANAAPPKFDALASADGSPAEDDASPEAYLAWLGKLAWLDRP